MTLTTMIEILKRMDRMIQTKSTGTPDVFAERLCISVRSLYNYLSLLKALGAPVCYSRFYESYEYSSEGNFVIKFEKTSEIDYAI